MSLVTRVLDLDGTSNVTALLGPTNTGKTHRAIQRMLRHRTGMIGLPLRLLAREVYDRVVAERSVQDVALVTGEEKILPADPKYWICTVEAMPMDRNVAFLAVDEIQLAGDRNRGHVFTDRLLHARGVVETLFLGAETIAPLLRRLLPSVEIHTNPRLSRLTHTGVRKLTSLPARSAVVAFSAERVYELAERLRAVHGGTAVVLGALSPRTRNAQVELYESGEVRHIVATDAIGMGLNMDVHHVALAALRKFDGRKARALHATEVAQIAGRAGRYRRDGTFGSLTEVGPLDPEWVEAVESHTFPPLPFLFWRNSELDTSDLDALLASLEIAPPKRGLVQVRDEDDHLALADLAQQEGIRARCTTPEAVALLWEVAQIPDFRKTLAHADLLGQIALHLLDVGRLPDDWVSARIDRLDAVHGDIETLMARIAFVRTWTYISWRTRWLRDAKHWQERTRQVEDRLSDALHEQLTRRFVDRRVMLFSRPDPTVEVRDDGTVWADTLRIGTLRGFRFTPFGDVQQIWGRVRKALRPELEARVKRAMDFEVDADGIVTWEGAPVARLEPGPALLEPKLRIHRLDLLEPPERDRVRKRLRGWLESQLRGFLAPLDTEAQLSGAAKGLLYAVRQGLGAVPVNGVRTQLRQLTGADRKAFKKMGVRTGTRFVYSKALLSATSIARRALLWSVHRDQRPVLSGPPAVPSERADPTLPRGFYEAVGYSVVAGRAVRVDVLEEAAAQARMRKRKRRPGVPKGLPGLLGCDKADAERIYRALGGIC